MTPPRSMSPTRTTGTSAALGEAHVGDVAGAQVDLGRAAGALDEHEVGLGGEPAKARQHRAAAAPASAPGSRAPWRCRRRGRAPRAARRSRSAASAAPGSCRLMGGDAAGAGLQRLGAADLAAVGGDGGVVGHVLRLERPHARGRGGRRRGRGRRPAATCRRRSRCPGTSTRAREGGSAGAGTCPRWSGTPAHLTVSACRSRSASGLLNAWSIRIAVGVAELLL